MFDWLGIGAVNGALLWGALLVASPIIIHLLSKRKFRVVDWAAMDFLLEADRRNRRRIRLEDLLLLLLRCLAVVLTAFLVSRLFVRPTGLAARAVETARFERIVLVDDSPSMEARLGSRTVFEEAKEGLAAFARQTARDRPGDTLTLLVTSQPNRPILSGQFLGAGKVEAAVGAIESLAVSDRAAAFDTALLALEEMLGSPRGNLNRVVTIITDLRQRDWAADVPAEGAAEPAGAAGGSGAPGAAPAGRAAGLFGILQRLSQKVEGLAIVNVGGPAAPNLAVTDIIVGEKTLVAGVPARFEVVVTNFGEADAAGVDVTFTAGGAMPLRGRLDDIKAGAQAAAPFTFTFGDAGPSAVQADIPVHALPRTSARFYAARVERGLPVLLVDGSPSGEYGESETFYLEHALVPPGEALSGIEVQTIAENQFDGVSLDRFQVVVLANLYRMADERVAALAQWVRAGGGLLWFLGDQVDETAYNEKLHAAGAGLLPLALAGTRGDESERQWVNLSGERLNHPILRVFEGAQNPFLGRVKFFRWWAGAVPKDDLAAGAAEVLAVYTDPDSSPAIVEKRLGQGRVLAVTTAADGQWSNWPADPSYLVTVLEMVRHAARTTVGEGNLAVGAAIRADLDPSRYSSEALLEAPGAADAVPVHAALAETTGRMALAYDETGQRGFYRLRLKRHDGTEEPVLYAANVEASEGDLRPADVRMLKRALGDAKVAVLEGRQYLAQGAGGAKSEIWRPILLGLVLVLGAEQGLAWWFGKRR